MASPTNPIAFTIFGIDISYYALLITAGIIVAFIIALKRCKKYGIDPEIMYDIILLMLPLGIIGARALHVMVKWDTYSGDIMHMINTRAGGLAIQGGIIGGIIGIIIICKIKKINIFKMLDIIAPTVAIAQAIGRWGNFFNMEAYGSETTLPWGILVRGGFGEMIKVHPTFLYESLWNVFVFLALISFFEKRKKYDGELAFWYLILYSVGRFFIEAIRVDSTMVAGLGVPQIISIGMIAVGVIGLVYLRQKGNKAEISDIKEEESK